ncbi:MAG: hypothetical protein ACI85K_003450 [Hyphomicrobiaceae bacterium]|jgi:hypothetical protein
MQSFEVPVRTHRESSDNATFQEMMSDRLKQSPWLLMSACMHAGLLLLIWVFLPPEQPKQATVSVQLSDTTKKEVKQPPPPPTPELKKEVDPEVTPINEVTVSELESEDTNESDQAENPSDSSLESNQWNTAVGLGPGAKGPYGKRGKGNGKNGGRVPSTHVKHGLMWLARHQDANGRWDADGFMKHDNPAMGACDGPGNAVHDVGVTALALLAFLGESNTMRAGIYKDNVKRGVKWLISQQEKDSGLIGGRAAHDFVYDHAIAAYALCEAYGLSNYKLLKKPAQRAIEYLESHRNAYSVWRYQPRDQDNDISVTGWAVMAYKSGKFFDLQVNDEALRLSGVFLDEVSDATGLHGYQKAGQMCGRKPGGHAIRFPPAKSQALTAVGLFCRFFLGQDPKEKPVMNAAANLLTKTLPVWNETDGSIDHYYWYYGTYALFQMGGKTWKQWQKSLERAVGPNQHSDLENTNTFGSWDPVGAWGEDGGRVYSTAILTLTMQANYRYTRLIR